MSIAAKVSIFVLVAVVYEKVTASKMGTLISHGFIMYFASAVKSNSMLDNAVVLSNRLDALWLSAPVEILFAFDSPELLNSVVVPVWITPVTAAVVRW